MTMVLNLSLKNVLTNYGFKKTSCQEALVWEFFCWRVYLREFLYQIVNIGLKLESFKVNDGFTQQPIKSPFPFWDCAKSFIVNHKFSGHLTILERSQPL